MARWQIFTVDRGGGRRPQTTSPTGKIAGCERFGCAADGSYATKELAERASGELRGEFADRETPVGVRQVPTAAEAAAKPRHSDGSEITGPAPSGRGRRLQRERLEREKDIRQGGSGESRRERNLRKARDLAVINKALRTAKGEDRKILLKERNIISRGTSTRKAKSTQPKNLTQAIASPRSEIRTTASIGDTLAEGRLDLTRGGEPLLFEARAAAPSTDIIRGEIRKEPPLTLSQKVSRKAQELEFEAEFKEEGFRRQAKAGGAFLLSAFAVPVQLFTNFPGFVKGVARTILHPVKSAEAIGAGLKTTPVTTLGTIGGAAATGKLIGTGVQAAKVTGVKLSPVKFDVTGKTIQARSISGPGQSKLIKIEPTKFAAQVAGKKFIGVGEGAGGITKKGLLGAAFKFDVFKKGSKKATPTIVGVKSIPISQRDFTRGFSISQAITKSKGKQIKQRAITPFIAKDIVGGDFPRILVKSGVILKGKRGRLQTTFGQVTVTRKVADVKLPGTQPVEFFEGLEKGIGAKAIKKAFPPTKLGKKGQFVGGATDVGGLVPLQRITKSTKKSIERPVPLVISQFTGAARKAVKGARISQLQPIKIGPLLPSQDTTLKLSTDSKLKSSSLIDFKPLQITKADRKPGIATRPIVGVLPSLATAPRFDVALFPSQTTRLRSIPPTQPFLPLFGPVPTTKSPPLFTGFFQETKSKRGKKKRLPEGPFSPSKVASVKAAFFNIRGKFPKIITGLEVRPLPLRRK